MISTSSTKTKIISSNSSTQSVVEREKIEVEKNNQLAFTNSNLWIRLVDKKAKIEALIGSSESVSDLSPEQKNLLHKMFTEELSTYGPMMFNTVVNGSEELWKVRNKLSPSLNSILFTPKVTITTVEQDDTDQEDVLFETNPFAIISDLLQNNEDLGITQIQNIENVLKKIKDNNTSPGSHLDLHNQIRLQSFTTEWIDADFVTRDAKLVLYLEHEQLMKTKAMEYLMTINNRIRVSTEFFDMFKSDVPENEPGSLFSRIKSEFGEENDLSLQEYKNMIEASKTRDTDEWWINNFSTDFDDYDGVTITLELVNPGYTTKENFSKIKPIQLLNENVINYFRNNGIIKTSTSDPDKASKNDELVYVPNSKVNNEQSNLDKDDSSNKVLPKTYLVIDAAAFMLHMLWLYAFEYKKLYDGTNPDTVSDNFLITFEVDMTNPRELSDKNDRYNGSLLNYVNIGNSIEDETEFSSFSLFDFDRLSFWRNHNGIDFSSFGFSYNNRGAYLWNWTVQEDQLLYTNLEYNSDLSSGWWIWKDLLTAFPETIFIESKERRIADRYFAAESGLENEISKDLVLSRFAHPQPVPAMWETEGVAGITEAVEIDYGTRKLDPSKRKTYEKEIIPDLPGTNKASAPKLDVNVKANYITELWSHYSYPIYITSVQDEKWLTELNLPIDRFLGNMIKSIYRWRLDAAKNYVLPNLTKEDVIVKDKLNPTINAGDTWTDNADPVKVERYSTKKPIVKNEDGKEVKGKSESEHWDLKITSQLDSFEQLTIDVVPHNRNYKNEVDAGFKSFIEAMMGDDDRVWLEIIVSDTNQHVMTKREYDIFLQIQRNVFDGIDGKSIAINKYYDNNVISLGFNSETVSDIAYEIGAFSLPSNVEEGLDTKIERIRKIIEDPGVLSPTDRAKLLNRLSMMKLMANSDNSEKSNIKSIVNWVDSISDEVGSTEMYNSISGSDFLTTFTDLGLKKNLVRSLYDSLLYKCNESNWYVPGIRMYSPMFIYSAFDSASALTKTTSEGGFNFTEDVYDMNSRVAPQTGMFKIMSLSETVDEFGQWTQDWEGVRLDYGFMNEVHNIVYDQNDTAKPLDILGIVDDFPNAFNSSMVVPSYIFDAEFFNKLSSTSLPNVPNVETFNSENDNLKFNSYAWFTDVYGLLSNARNITQEEEFFNRYRTDLSFYLLAMCTQTHKDLAPQDLSYINPYVYQQLWPFNSGVTAGGYVNQFEAFTKKAESGNREDLELKFRLNAYDVTPLKPYNATSLLIPYKAFAWAMNSNDWWYSTTINNELAGFVTHLNSGNSSVDIPNVIGTEAAQGIHPVDSFINSETEEGPNAVNPTDPYTKVYTNISDFEKDIQKGNICIDTGTVITIQREDHASISDDLTLMNNKIKFGDNYIPSENLKLFDTIDGTPVKAWRTIERYMVVDSPSVVGDILSEETSLFFESMLEDRPNEGIGGWTKFVQNSINPKLPWYTWLSTYRLGYRANFRGVSPNTYHLLMIVKWAQSFLSSFFDKSYIKKPYHLRSDPAGGYSLSPTEFGEEFEPLNFKELYTDYVDFGQYKSAISLLSGQDSMKDMQDIFTEIVRRPLSEFVSTSAFTESVNKRGGGFDIAKTLVNNKYETLKKDFSAWVTTIILPEFLNEWLELARQRFDLVDAFDRTDNTAMRYDFALVYITDIKDVKSFSAVRWDYLKNRYIENSGSTLCAEFISNTNLNQLLNLRNRNERYFYENIGLEPSITNRPRPYDKWFLTDEDRANFLGSTAYFESVNYDPKKGNKNFSDDKNLKNSSGKTIADYQGKYGALRILVTDKFTAKRVFLDDENNVDSNKLQIVDTWNYYHYGYTSDIDVTFVPNYVGWNDPNKKVYSLLKAQTAEDPLQP